jgi:hypothetical protein
VLPFDGDLVVSGAVRSFTLVREDGRVLHGTSGDRIAVGPGGTAKITHDSGPILAWLTSDANPGPWPAMGSVRTTTLSGPAQLPGNEQAHRFEVAIDRPAMVHVRSTSPLIARSAPHSGSLRVDVLDGGTLDLLFGAGTGALTLRALDQHQLQPVEIGVSYPVTIGEGLGPEVLVAPGETRVFAFDVHVESDVGIGVNASADRVEAVLMTSRGERVGHGLVQMQHLSPGSYLLALRLPKDASPVRARPALAGIDAPDRGPPQDVVRQYLAKAEALR